MYVCMYVCMFVCMSVCVYVYVCVCVCVGVYVCGEYIDIYIYFILTFDNLIHFKYASYNNSINP